RFDDAKAERVADGHAGCLAGNDAQQEVEPAAVAGEGGFAHTIPSSSCTSTAVPGSTLPTWSPRMMKQLASLIDLRIPEPCSPVGFTTSAPPASRLTTPRWNSVRPGAF